MLGIARGSLLVILALYALYVASFVALLAWAGLWMTDVASATAFWFAGPGMVMFLKVNEALTNPHYLRDLVRRALWFVLGVEFLVNFFPLPLWVEIGLVPLLAVIILLGVVPPDARGATGAKKFSDCPGRILRFLGRTVRRPRCDRLRELRFVRNSRAFLDPSGAYALSAALLLRARAVHGI
jgi:hypothetical protein